MSNISDIEKRALSTFSYGERPNPARDWFMLLVVAAILLLASAAMNVLIYEGVKNVANNGTAPAAVSGLDASAINTVESVFKARDAQMQNYEKVYEFVDPSK